MIVQEEEMRLLNQIAERLRAIGHPVRLLIFGVLKGGCEQSVSTIAERLGQPVAVVSRHLKSLERANLLTSRREGRNVLYSIQAPMVKEICAAVCHQIEHELAHSTARMETLSTLRSRLQQEEAE